jgi:hypothetical protein
MLCSPLAKSESDKLDEEEKTQSEGGKVKAN